MQSIILGDSKLLLSIYYYLPVLKESTGTFGSRVKTMFRENNI